MREEIKEFIQLYGVVEEGSVVADEDQEEREEVESCQRHLKSSWKIDGNWSIRS